MHSIVLSLQELETVFAFHDEAIVGCLQRLCLQTSKPCVHSLGSCPTYDKVVDGKPLAWKLVQLHL